MPGKKSKCNIKMLMIAANAAYYLRKNNLINSKDSEAHKQSLRDIKHHAYKISKTITPKYNHGRGENSLSALCLQPKSLKSPIIISFRGTADLQDLIDDSRIVLTGVTRKSLRDAAFNFYKDIRNKHPDREIILTGHSLGGHLAQYVGIKAYGTQTESSHSALLQVRTFNTAPISTSHERIFKQHPELLKQFAHYRLETDVISNSSLHRYVGNTFVFKCKEKAVFAHTMGALETYLPKEIQEQEVGSNTIHHKDHNSLIEFTRGFLSSYQCRIEGQFFSQYRAGRQNLEHLNEYLPKVIKLIEKNRLKEAIIMLELLKTTLDGKVSNQIVSILIAKTQKIDAQADQQQPTLKVRANLSLFKKNSEQEASTDQNKHPSHPNR